MEDFCCNLNGGGTESESHGTSGDTATADSQRTGKPGVGPLRLTFAGEAGVASKLKIVEHCFQYKASLFGTGERTKIYKLVCEDLNKYEEMFHGVLKENTVRDVWNKAVTEAQEQQVSKEEKHHLWYNGSILRQMSAWELLLDELFSEFQKYSAQKAASAAAEAAEEKDKRDGINAAFDRVNARAEQSGSSRSSPAKGPGDGDANDETEAENEKAYGRGTSKGQQKRAHGNPGLSPDPKPDRLSEACSQQAEISRQVNDILGELAGNKREVSEFERDQLKIQKISATASLMETYLKFVVAGVELPQMFKEALGERE